MTTPFQDSFTTRQTVSSGQSSNTTYTGTWEPNSSRTLNGVTTAAVINGTGELTFNPGIVEVSYIFTLPQDLSNVTAIYFTNYLLNSTDPSDLLNLTATASNGITTQSVGTTSVTLIAPGNQSITLPIHNTNNVLSSATSITITANLSGGAGLVAIFLQNFYSIVSCVAHDSKILTPFGYRYIQDLRRGDEIVGGKIARIIKAELHPKQVIDSIIFPPSSLEKDIPDKETIVCSDHYLVYKNKRRLAKCFLSYPIVKVRREEAKNVLPVADDNKYYLYDIQFDHEGEYIVNGLVSQSRSPYALSSPLPKELYFEEKNYKEERVNNTLCQEPPISVKYLLPNGEESGTFCKMVPKNRLF